mgnify:CR=1 FL=1|tara:strand:- start:1222 stop:1434 length:213 start_codon:yes stop_codon:yes gene_type:complete
MYPAAKSSISALVIVIIIFTASTILTMLAAVIILSLGLSFRPLKNLERYTQAIAGATICLSGLAIQVFSL